MVRRRFEIPAGERRVVIDRRSGSIPRGYVLSIVAADGGAVTGSVEVQGSRWLFRRDPVTQPIGPEIHVHKGFWDTLFRVAVTPDSDAIVVVT